MEILNTIDGGVLVPALIAGGILFVMGLLVIYTSFSTESVLGYLFGFVLAGVGLCIGYESVDAAPDQIEAIVTDYNEVYERGYEVVEQRGDITVLQKRESEAE